MSIVESVLRGDRLALARLLTKVENNTADGLAALQALFPHTGRAHLVGITGAPGTGKSSLANRLALHYRGLGKMVAIVAVDPSSPFTGGAILGDRVRMKDLSGDTQVFIRSTASRGALGGLAQSTAGIVQVFDAAGYDIVLIETVGAGQGEVDIVRTAHTTLVVEAPGLGDDIQAIKAGILEIADILVINKADRPGVDNTEKALRSVLELGQPARRVYMHHGQSMSDPTPVEPAAETWGVPIQRTIAPEGTGVPELVEQIEKHAAYLRASGNWAARDHAHLESELELTLQQALMSRFREQIPAADYDALLKKVGQRQVSPREAVVILMDGKYPAMLLRPPAKEPGRK